MTSENQNDPYEAVLADLQAKRDQIDQTIALLTALRGGERAPIASASGDNGIVETAGMFLGMSIVDAAKKLLSMRKRTMGNPEICKELQAGGLVLTGKEPVNVIGSVLSRRFNEVGDIVKVGRGIWGLKEWYPGRNFKPAAKPANGGDGTPQSEDTAPMTIDDLMGDPPAVQPDDEGLIG